MRRTALAQISASFAIMSAAQCVVSAGGSSSVSATTRRNARGPRLVAQQPFKAFLSEALLPAPDAGLGLAGPPHDFDGANTVGAQQHDLGTPDMLLRTVAVADQAISRR